MFMWQYEAAAQTLSLPGNLFAHMGYHVLAINTNEKVTSPILKGIVRTERYQVRSALKASDSRYHGGYLHIETYKSRAQAVRRSQKPREGFDDDKGGLLVAAHALARNKVLILSATALYNIQHKEAQPFVNKIRDYLLKKKVVPGAMRALHTVPKLKHQRPPRVKGAIDQRVATRVRQQHFSSIAHCIEKYRRGYPLLIEAPWNFALIVGRSGNVAKVYLSNANGSLNAGSSWDLEKDIMICVQKALKGWRFPKANSGTTIDDMIRFRPMIKF